MTAVHDLPAIAMPRTRSCPYAPPDEYAALREESPARRLSLPDGREGWLFTRYADVRAMLADPRVSTRDRITASPVRNIPPEVAARLKRRRSLLTMDGAEHAHMRKLMVGAFTVRRMRALEPRVLQIVTDHLDAMEAAGPPADLVSAFGLPIPSLVICELLGVPYADRDFFQAASAKLLSITLDPAVSADAGDELRAYMLQLVRAKRREPDDRLLSALAAPEHGLTDGQLADQGITLLIAGHETTANMIGLSVFTLLQRGGWAELVADPSLVPNAVEELLRYLSVIQFGVNRIAAEDFTLGGVDVKAGDLLYGAVPSANHDPDKFDRPDELDLHRERPAHVAFGHGVHQCLGQQLARVELAVVFTELPRRFPTLRLAVPAEQVPMRDDMSIYGVHRLPVEWAV